MNTNLYNTVSSIPNNFLYNLEHGLRPPLGQYNVSTKRVFDAFEEVINSLNSRDKDYEQINKNHEELLESLMSFIDDGYLMMKSLFPKAAVTKKPPVFADAWLKKVDNTTEKIISDYKKDLNPYRDQLSKIVNKVKHNHARYSHLKMATIHGQIHGYFIEGVDAKGSIIPDVDIHPEFNGGYTAISFNKDLKKYFVHFYIIANLISRALYQILDKHHNYKLIVGKVNSPINDRVLDVFKMVMNLDDLFFPDEYQSELPQLILHSKDKIELREEAFKAYKNKLKKYSNAKVDTIHTSDGVSNSLALPYLST